MPRLTLPIFFRIWYEWFLQLLFSSSYPVDATVVSEPESTGQDAASPMIHTHAANLALLECLSKPSGQRPAVPVEIVLQIVDHPTRWRLVSTLYECCTLSGPKNVSYLASGEDLASTPVLTVRAISVLRALIFTFESKDQGWSSYPEDRGTFRNSWTWFQARIQSPNQVEQISAPQDIDEDESALQHQKSIYRLQANRHAGSELEIYRIEFGPSSQLLRSLQPGDQVILSAHAQFAGWVNHVNHAAIEILCADNLQETSDDFG